MKEIYIIITPFFPSKESFRGPFILDQVKAIEKTGKYEVFVFRPTTWFNSEPDYFYEEVRVFRFKTFELPSAFFPGLLDKLSISSFLEKLKKTGVDIKKITYVHSHVTAQGIYANVLKQKNPKIKTILQHHGFDVLSISNGTFNKYYLHRKLTIDYGVHICNKIDLHIGVSRKTLDFLKEFPGIFIRNQYVLYNGIDKSKFFPLKNNITSISTDFTIGCIGNFWEIKDQITLIKAVEIIINRGLIKNLKVLLIGTGYTRAMCESYVKEAKLECYFEFIDSIKHNELIHYYNSLNLFVLPSYYEAFGCVYAEAHACGIPFIAVKDQGISEIISKDAADDFLITAKDAAGLSRLILKIYQQPYNITPIEIDLDINNLIDDFLQAIN